MVEEKKLLSIVLPAFNEQDMIETAYQTINDTMTKNSIPYEIIFVDDGSSDNTYTNIEKLSASGISNVHGISFSRNFGKESAMFAGLKTAVGEAVVVMDCDMQHPVDTVVEMYRLWSEEGYEVVEGVKTSRGRESFIHKGFAKLFYSIMSGFTGINMRNTSDFKLLDRKAVDALLEMPERMPFFRGLTQWIGFKSVKIPFEVQERTVGKTKWSTGKLVKYAIHNISIFSSKPLQLVTILGAIFFIFGIGVGIEALARYFEGTSATGFPTVIGLILISSGVIMLSLGIIGNYIGLIFDEVKARPKYIIKKQC